MFVIGPWQAADLAALADIEAENAGAWNAVQLAAELERPGGFQWLIRARADGPALGLLCGRLVLDEAEILRLAVTARHRRQGLASALLRQALAWLADQGIRACHLEVRAANQGAIALYQGLGFAVQGRRPGYYAAPADDAIIMSKFFATGETAA